MNDNPKTPAGAAAEDRRRKWDRTHMRVLSAKVPAGLAKEFHTLCKKEHVSAHKALMCYAALCVERAHVYIPSAAEHAADKRRSPARRYQKKSDKIGWF